MRASASCSLMTEKEIARAHWRSREGVKKFVAPRTRGATNFLTPCFLPVPFLFPWVRVIMIAALLPETRAVALHKLQAIEPLGALIEVEPGHQQAYRATVIGFQIL